MADAKPSRPNNLQAPSKMEINIPVAGEQILKLEDGSVVSRATYGTGSYRDNVLFAKDYPDAQTLAEIELAELKAKEPAKVEPKQADPDSDSKSPAPDSKPAPKPTRGKGGKGKGA